MMARCSSVVPPQMPHRSRYSRAFCRHSTRTGHSAHRASAAFTSRERVRLPGWNQSGSSRFTLRAMNLTTAGGAASRFGTFFAKPPRDKTFKPRLYSAPAFSEVARAAGLEDDEPFLVADPVDFGREYRLLVLDGQVHTGSRYLSWGALDPLPLKQDAHAPEILAFAAELLEDQAGAVPAAFTLDVGYAVNKSTGDEGWAVVEANMAWFSNIYACDTAKALDFVVRAAGPARLCSSAELAFNRAGEPRQ